MSEVGVIASCDFPEANAINTVGKLSKGTQVKIVDEHGNRCGPNVDGEICVRKTHYKILGYFANKSATDELLDAEGFLQTGDIGHFDENGCLCFVDRKKDLWKYNNIHISPSEIEAFLLESPHIHSACVVGIPSEGNDLPAAVIVRASSSNISEREVYDLIAGKFEYEFFVPN